jgi:hypothetical protein
MNDDFMRLVSSIDLTPVVFNLTKRKDGPKWSLSKTRTVEKWYRRFLFLVGTYRDVVVVPTLDIDEFWHTHILDTRKYMADCDMLFGEYLHHFPYFGQRGTDDEETLHDSYYRTLALFELHFNDAPHASNSLAPSVCGNCSSCGGHIESSRGAVLKPDIRPHATYDAV